MIKKIVFLSELFAQRVKPLKDMAMISISDEEDVDLPDWGDRILRLRFFDIDQRHIDDWPNLVKEYVIFTTDHARQILDFLHRVENQVECVVVHCGAGVSRSAGVAFFIADKYGIEKFKRAYKNYKIYNKLVYSTLTKVDNEVNGGVL